jgi:hypothetical protein
MSKIVRVAPDRLVQTLDRVFGHALQTAGGGTGEGEHRLPEVVVLQRVVFRLVVEQVLRLLGAFLPGDSEESVDPVRDVVPGDRGEPRVDVYDL